jgi:hypothetical protein
MASSEAAIHASTAKDGEMDGRLKGGHDMSRSGIYAASATTLFRPLRLALYSA